MGGLPGSLTFSRLLFRFLFPGTEGFDRKGIIESRLKSLCLLVSLEVCLRLLTRIPRLVFRAGASLQTSSLNPFLSLFPLMKIQHLKALPKDSQVASDLGESYGTSPAPSWLT